MENIEYENLITVLVALKSVLLDGAIQSDEMANANLFIHMADQFDQDKDLILKIKSTGD